MIAPGASDTARSNGSSARAPESDPSDADDRLGIGGRLLWLLLWLLPKNALSRLAGRLASWRLPGPIQRAELRLFARLVGVDLSEAALPIEAYPSLQAFFTRALREGARPIEGDDATLVAPCDGRWGAAGPIDGGTLLQVKGRTYRLRELLGDVDAADAFEGGFFATFYLSPRDYHRFHTPVAGRIRCVDYWPGALWPVNHVGLHGIPDLFARNERLCAYLEPDDSREPDGAFEVLDAERAARSPTAIALVAVGATMVGSVRLSFDPLTTNRPGAAPERRELGARAPRLARGEQWGHFEFGSTIVMLLPPDAYELDVRPAGSPLRLGEEIGRRLGVDGAGR